MNHFTHGRYSSVNLLLVVTSACLQYAQHMLELGQQRSKLAIHLRWPAQAKKEFGRSSIASGNQKKKIYVSRNL